MKDCDTIQGGERIHSKVITSGCYSFTVLSHPDSSTIPGKDLSCPNKIVSQVPWLRRTSKRGRAEDWVPGGSWYKVACPASHHRQRGCSHGEGMSLLEGWENGSSETVPAWKILPNWNNWVLYLKKKKKKSIHNLQLQFSEHFWQRLTKGTSWTR